MTIADRLDEAMRDAGKLSQAELARRSKVPQPTINRILKGDGKKGPETATLVALASALKVEFLWLQQGVGPKSTGATRTEADLPPVVREVERKHQEVLRHWLTEDEADVLNRYRSMTDDAKRLTRLFVKRQKLESVGGPAGGVADKS